MNEFEKALKAALGREPAPDRLMERVLEKASKPSARVTPWWHMARWRMPIARWAALATVVVVIAGGLFEHEEVQRSRGEQARQQVLLALRITGSKLCVVQRQLAQQPIANFGGGHP